MVDDKMQINAAGFIVSGIIVNKNWSSNAPKPGHTQINTYRKTDNSVRYCTLWKQRSASRGTVSHHRWARREQRKTKQKNHCNTEPEEKDMVLTVVGVDAFRSLVYLTYDFVRCVTEETVKISWSNAMFIGLRNVGLGACWCVCVLL